MFLRSLLWEKFPWTVFVKLGIETLDERLQGKFRGSFVISETTIVLDLAKLSVQDLPGVMEHPAELSTSRE